MDRRKRTIIATILSSADDDTANLTRIASAVIETAKAMISSEVNDELTDDGTLEEDSADSSSEILVPALDDFHCYFRLTKSQFEVLMRLLNVEDQMCYKISLERQILFTIWMLAHNSSFSETSKQFNISKGTGHYIFNKQIKNINRLFDTYIKWPSPAEKSEIESEFENTCCIAGVVGCIGNCIIPIKQMVKKSEKRFKSFLLQAVCNNRSIFTNICIAPPDRVHERTIFNDSDIHQQITNMLLPQEEHIIGDSGFPLMTSLLTPYNNYNLTQQQSNFNDKLMLGEKLIQNAFVILKNQFQKLTSLEINDLILANEIISASCILHNFMREDNWLEDNMAISYEAEETFSYPIDTPTVEAISKRDIICLSL